MQELTPKVILLAAVYGIIVGFILYGVVLGFHRSRYVWVLVVLFALIFVIAEIVWLNRERISS